ncbi:DUF6083 domain-containing protein [Streptomyces sp. NPDC101152]|uniref:DUF6083 domain-containing protein n=1 Tax=Streptomyces sp. NPDC101152 TaxID=3366116 RepID=UPI00380BE106
MRPNTASTGRHWDGNPRTTRARRLLRVAATSPSPSRLLRCGQSGRCRLCGNRIEVYLCSDQRPVALHPDELATAQIPESCRWHLSCGIAHPHADGSAWCRIPHTVLCPGRTPPAIVQLSPHIEAVRRQLAVRSRRLIDTGAFTLPAPSDPACEEQTADARRPARPVVQLLLGRYLADRPLEEIRCVAQTRQRRRCPQAVLAAHAAAGRWTLLPAGPQRGAWKASAAALGAVVLDPGLTTLGAAIAAEQHRLTDHRWRVTLQYNPSNWGGGITGITAPHD